MEALLIYILKSAGLLSIFYLAYLILLKRDTSFQANRKFLLGGILASAVLPAIYFTRTVVLEANNFSVNQFPVATQQFSEEITSTFNMWEVLGIIYILIATFLLGRIAVQLYSVFKLVSTSKIYKSEKYKFIKTDKTLSPFSFFKYIVYNPSEHSAEDLEMILQHEKIHASQHHSLDIIIVNLTTALLWFNPLSWLYKKSIEQNLEYIADRETVAISGAKKSYQQALVKVSIANIQPALTNHFYQSFIKKRILMLNKKSTQNPGLWKISLVFPAILAFMLTFNVKTEAQTKNEFAVSSVEYHDDLKISAVITKFSEKESFKRFSKLFKKYNVQLEFSEIEYSKDLLTGIKVSYLNTETNETGVFSASNSEGIESFEFYKNEGKTGFRKANALMRKGAISSNGSLLNELGKNPLYIIDGKKYASKELNGRYLDITKKGISISLPEEALERFGNKAQDGAIIANNARIIDGFKEELERIDEENIEIKREFLQIEQGKTPTLISLKTNAEKTTQKRKNAKAKSASQDTKEIPGDPIYILNGEKSKKEIIELIDNKLIQGVTVLKGESAVSLYGEEAKDGAVIITTKVLDKSKKEESKKEKGHSFGIQRFERKTDYEIIKREGISFRTGEDINAFQWNKEPAEKINFYINDEEKTGPIIIIDGKKKNGAALKELEPKNIEKINVLKGDVAIEKYGKKADYGAIEVTTKKEVKE
ncbi:M56 family metallopeptidase [Salegentibacter salarius]|uniref:Peptidase M56 domain-containing protein n=1 Tax=Salegentibacter salarius TaxID=435906 RepID=A0A2N0U2W3_9FLAO|nr:M56 family metallopeptidase [Salegentibacter salarius]OEY73786.1 hypothetical protein BHS39_07420 [Salegentibacter salarius]PKD21246.1 hypothetical protein APR40_07415 [Salegentibacter salarius]SLJ93767.1 Signal transducer regulating beta-lactamase production, contains metallopeptidase domain [Salegentibacter salarius]